MEIIRFLLGCIAVPAIAFFFVIAFVGFGEGLREIKDIFAPTSKKESV